MQVRDVYLSNGFTVILIHLNIDNSSNVKRYHFKSCIVQCRLRGVYAEQPNFSRVFLFVYFFMTPYNSTIVVANTKLPQFC